MSRVRERRDVPSRRGIITIYRNETDTGYSLEVYQPFGQGHYLAYRRYFYGTNAESQSRESFAAEVGRAEA